MPIPNFQDTMLPLPAKASDGAVHPWRDLRDVQVAVRGKEVLAGRPDRVDMQVLSRFDDYREFRSRTRTSFDEPSADAGESASTQDSPLEAIAEAVRESNVVLTADVLRRVLDQPPVFLEQLVLTLLSAMGYGGRAGASSEHMGRSGDGGIDGVVRQDVLGLDRVYVQAKRYAADHAVGRPDIQASSARCTASRPTGVCSSRPAGSVPRPGRTWSASRTGSCSSTAAGWPS